MAENGMDKLKIGKKNKCLKSRDPVRLKRIEGGL
jgi:hypothetical protein